MTGDWFRWYCRRQAFALMLSFVAGLWWSFLFVSGLWSDMGHYYDAWFYLGLFALCYCAYEHYSAARFVAKYKRTKELIVHG